MRAPLRGWRAGPYDGVRSSVKASVSAVLAWLTAQWLVGSGSDFSAPLVAVLTVQTTVASTVRDGVQRLGGVAIGLGLGYVQLHLVGQVSWWSLGVTLFVATLLSRWHRLGPQGAQIPIAALLMLLFAQKPSHYAETLLAEGVIGATVATLVNLALVPPLHVHTAQQAMAQLRREAGSGLDRMSRALAAEMWPPERRQWDEDVRTLTSALDTAREAVDRGSESVRLNPRARRLRHLPHAHSRALVALERVVVSVRELTRLLDAAASGPGADLRLPPPFRQQLSPLLGQVGDAVTFSGDPSHGLDAAAQQRPLDLAQEQLTRLQHQIAAQPAPAAPLLLTQAALLSELEQIVRELRRTPAHQLQLTAAR